MPPTYDQQYCEKHDQKYGEHLHRCPICWGEELGKEPITITDYTGKLTEEDINKLIPHSGVMPEIHVVQGDKGD